MASRVKEDEKNERIIRGLLKLPANRRCINCNSLGPQYVCTNFWTFICINCSGIHREFTHRVKSISMANFSPQEVSSLQEGGNERAKEIYFKEWDPHRHSFPDSSNIDRLREFIKHVYVDRRFTGGRSSDEPPKNLHRLREFIKHVYVDRRFTGGRSSDEPPKRETVDSYGKNKVDTYQGSRSPQYDNTDIRRYSERLGSVSPPSDYKTSPGQFDRDDRSGYQSQDRSTVDQQFPDSSKRELMSPNQHNKVDGSKSPKSQPVSVVSIPPASIGEPAKPSGLQLPRSSAHAQNTASSSSRGSSTGNPVELKAVSSRSLIDFDADPVPPTTRAMDHSVPQLTTGLNTESGGWASFDDSSSLKVKQVIEADTLLSQLSVTQIASAAKDPSISIAGIGSFSNQSNTGQWTTIQQHQPPLSQASIQSNNQPFNTSFIGAPDNRVAPTSLTVQSSQALFVPLHEANNAISPQFTSTEPKPSGRKELPADLFTMTYPSTFTQFPYYRPPQHPMGYGMQYPTVFAMPSYPHPSTLPNPFAPTDESKLVHASTFPNLAHLQSALPNVAGHSSILRISSMPSQQWLPQQVPISTTPQSPFPMQQGGGPMPQPPPNTMYHVMRQTIGGFNTEGAAFNFSGIDQNLDSRNYRPHSPNTSTPGRNPFG